MRFLYPSDPLDAKRPDAAYRDEFETAMAAGHFCSLFSLEALERNDFHPRPALQRGAPVLYRGWMLRVDVYGHLCGAIESSGAFPLTSPGNYQLCHHLPHWYALCREFTPETVFLAANDDFGKSLAGLDWPAYFVKDHVKSLTTSRGSVAGTVDEVAEVVSMLERYRGSIEGGVCVRRFETLLPGTEERYFVFRGHAFGRDDSVPDMVAEIARRIPSPFYSVDVMSAPDGVLRLIELGDGQVSDRKQWPVQKFIQMFGTEGTRSFPHGDQSPHDGPFIVLPA